MSATSEAAGKELSVFEKISNIFFAPRKTFESLDRKPDWIIPLVIVLLITFIVTSVLMPIIMPEQMAKQRAKMEERGMSQDEIDRAMAATEKFSGIFGTVMGVIGTLIMLLIIAALLLFVGNVILGGQTSFKKMFSGLCYSSLISSLGSIILTPIILAKKSMDVSFSFASFLSSDASETLIYEFLKKIDFFAIWEIIVLAIGFSVFYKFSTKKSMITIGSLYAIYVIISLAVKSIF
ncbi:MAG: YIP1 family protein [candidate division KSB1 bacterium]|jgi:hypothetical protein|nr:YIP1 family protein [candidate division KSB1 bacterium]